MRDAVLEAFLATKDADCDQTQTIAPSDISVGSETSSSFVVSWTPIPYQADTGWYSVIAPAGWILSDGFETGDTGAWSGAGG